MATSQSIPRRATAPLVMLSLILSLSAFVLAQEPPRVQLDATRFAVGAPVTLNAEGLAENGSYRLTLEGPDDDQIERTLQADPDGKLTHTFELSSAGEWTLLLAGDGASASLVLEVTEPEGEEVGGEPGVETEPDGEATRDGEADRQDDAAAQDEAAVQDDAAPEEAETTDAADDADEEGGVANQESQEPGEAGPDTAADPETEEDISLVVDGEAVVGMRGDSRVWRFDFPDESGGTGALLDDGERIWVGHGNSVLMLERESGRALARHPMPGRVMRLESADAAVSVVNELTDRLRQRIEVDEDGPVSEVRFGSDPEVFDWLRNEANVPDPAARLERDPTNPWLHLRVGLADEDSATREATLREALEQAKTFYDLAGIARELYQAGEPQLAREAMDSALEDFADRGYVPALLTDAELHRAYDFPLAPMEEALANADLDDAGFWAPWLYLTASEETPETGEALAEYARQLGTVGQRDAASLWRERARDGRSASPAASLDRFFLGLGRSGWYGVAALLAAIVALHLTLWAKYWAPQSLAIRRRKETGGSGRPWTRVLAMRYYSFTEKLVLVLLFASCLALLGLTSWYDAGGDRPRPLATGTLASPIARDLVTSASLQSDRGAFIRGYAAQTAGEQEAALEEYLAAADYPPALNNRAVLEGDDVLYQRALELAPGMPEAAYNLGRRTDPSPFHAAYLADEPLLAVPGAGDFRIAISGSWRQALGNTFENPWRALRGTAFFGLPALLWQVLLALFLLWMLVTVIWLFIPRPSFARNAPRTGLYHLLALLVPGSGLADEAWGVLLMVPWALLGVDALSQWLGWERSLGLPLETELWALGAIYLVNLIAFVVEFLSYRRRMRELKRRHPEAIEAYSVRGA